MTSEEKTLDHAITRPREKELNDLNRTVALAVSNARPPADLTVSEWADRYRRLSSETSAEAGKWKTSRTPYLKEIMDAFTDPRVRRETIVACSQLGKSEAMNNMLGYVIAQDPGSAIWVGPSKEDIKLYTKQRIDPLLRDTPCIRRKMDQGTNTALLKTFPGGMLKMAGSNSANDLSSTPCRYAFCDERDRWATDADGNGDPFMLVQARTTTFYNYKMVEVSTPTIKGHSQIADAFFEGTQEYWETECPACGEYHFIEFDDIHFKSEKKFVDHKATYKVTDVNYCCPACGCLFSETEIRKAKKKWVAKNPEAYDNHHRSFWLNGFMSPWNRWPDMILQFLNAKDDPAKLQTVFNTKFGQLWEERSDLVDSEELMDRCEPYDAEIPDGVLVLTMGVDTQDNRLEYEVVGHGYYDETWGIEKGIIPGKPDAKDTPEQESVWTRLDRLIDRKWSLKNGKQLKISITLVDSGGHYTQDVYEQCARRLNKRVFPIKGKGGEGIPYAGPPSKVNIIREDNKGAARVVGKSWLYILGVDAGKERIMSAVKVQTPGARYCHFPDDEKRGYDLNYFNGLMSETLNFKAGKWKWEKLPGHQRNEALDCRNYANAGIRIINPNFDHIAQMLRDGNKAINTSEKRVKTFKKQAKRSLSSNSDW